MRDLPIHPHLVHPVTGAPLRAVFVSEKTGRVYWPILGGNGEGGDGGGGDGGGSGGSGGSGGAGDGGGDGYAPPATQAELDRIIEQRLSRERKRYSDYDELKAKAEKHDALELELGSDKDKAVAAAREEERSKASDQYAPRLVRQAFKAEAKGVLTPEQLDALLEDLDLSKYLDKDGDVDEDKVTKKVKAFAPDNSGGGGKDGGGKVRTLGQGKQRQATMSARERGQAEAAKRFGTKEQAS